jgi:23S rRNA (uridine2552-2'-O)-methyltransferase
MTFKVKDHYFKKAKQENFVARSIYKLEEIDEKYHVLKKNDQVLDLGYYPGSWVQYSSAKVGMNGIIIGCDIQPINEKISALKNVKLFQKDVFQINSVKDLGLEKSFDVVISDMAPSTTGIKSVDQTRSLELVEKVFDLLDKCLRPGGNFVIKVFESQDAQTFLKSQKKRFKELNYLRPKSTRSVSKEYFAIGKDFVC